MLNISSTTIGVSLACIANDRKINLTPKAGSLIAALSQSSKNTLDLYARGAVEDISHALVECSKGGTVSENGHPQYAVSSHDTLMDNYIVELAQIVGTHINFARQVVHTKIKSLEDAVRGAFAVYPIKEAEDFFEVTFYQHHDIFKSYLISDEVKTAGNAPRSADLMNFGEVFTPDFDVAGYFVTGDEELDNLIKSWVGRVGKQTILSYLAPKSNSFESTLYGPAAMDFYLTNFLLYRQLAIKKDMGVGMSELQMTTTTANNRDYYAGQLAFHLNNYDSTVRNGVLLSPDSQTAFSYLSSSKFSITIYEESFAQLQGEDSALEKIYGSIARFGAANLTVEQVKAQGTELVHHWKNVRALYTSYLVSSRSQMLKSSLKIMLANVIDQDVGEDKDSPIFDEAYRTKTMELASEYIDTLQSSDADDLYKVCMEVMGRIVYRFSNAYFFIREMYEILERDDSIDPQEATHAASVRYITDFLMEQTDITKRTGV